MKTVIVTGGRDYDDLIMVSEVLGFLNPDLIVQGGAAGADILAKEWAQEFGKCVVTINADWSKHGKAVGPLRNIEMIEAYPEAVVVAFPGGKGTKSCIGIAKSLNRIILEVVP